jgi:hypothetical protein
MSDLKRKTRKLPAPEVVLTATDDTGYRLGTLITALDICAFILGCFDDKIPGVEPLDRRIYHQILDYREYLDRIRKKMTTT